MYNLVECHLCISECAISSETEKVHRVKAWRWKSNHRSRWLDDALVFLPAYEYNDCCDHRGEEHKTTEHPQGDHGPQIQLGLMAGTGLFSTIHPEGTRRFRHTCADTRLCVIHATSGYLVILRMIAAVVTVEH